VFVFVLSSDFELNPWCMDELACAITNDKRVVFVRDAHATIPRLDSVEGVPGLVHIHKRLPELAEECLEALVATSKTLFTT